MCVKAEEFTAAVDGVLVVVVVVGGSGGGWEWWWVVVLRGGGWGSLVRGRRPPLGP